MRTMGHLALTVEDYELFPDDGRRHELRIYRRDASGGYARPLELAAERGDLLTSPLLPGLELAVAALFAAGPAGNPG